MLLWYKSSPRFVQLQMSLFRAKFNSLVAMRLVTFLARVLACQNLGKALNTDLDTSLYMTWFEIAVSASLF